MKMESMKNPPSNDKTLTIHYDNSMFTITNVPNDLTVEELRYLLYASNLSPVFSLHVDISVKKELLSDTDIITTDKVKLVFTKMDFNEKNNFLKMRIFFRVFILIHVIPFILFMFGCSFPIACFIYFFCISIYSIFLIYNKRYIISLNAIFIAKFKVLGELIYHFFRWMSPFLNDDEMLL
ncbi:hypothetical protein TRFO_14415 [Tritrichomonas foetus]|uniref:Uncharacterized protein n=1 Tax=Tritrichomonas foetus TaxID=1144522 RepID=A0A1J4KUV3_9EUKA|nr:hypothetical protein TRFO_14415 [Tritrichomonas foetus]|eukprot:OHT15073.1 hypothetical protein TRFO_14415 [Tritrichomonas foetus]